MGYADRDYYRQGQGQGQAPGRLAGAPVTKWLLISNVVLWLLDVLLQPEAPVGAPSWYYEPSVLTEWGYFSVETGIQKFQIWRILSFQFLHAHLGHVALNMWGIFLFGPFLERWFRSKPFLIFYLLSGIGGALFYSLMVIIPGGLLPDGMVGDGLVGASAGVFGILVGVAVIAPDVQVRLLFPPIAMTMRTMALVFLAIEVFMVLTNRANAGGSAGHLGGALAGFLMLKIPTVRGWLTSLGSGTQIMKRKPAKKKRVYEKKLRPKSSVTKDEASEVDRILDKINRDGLHSLTDEERELLKRAAGD
jgi:membrane associated rhomboid family serine protease